MGIEVVGSDGRIIIDNTGDGRNKRGEWTGTYRATGTIWRGPDVPGERHNMVAESFSAPDEYEHSLAPPDPTNPDESLPGISAGVRDLIAVLLDDAPIVSRIYQEIALDEDDSAGEIESDIARGGAAEHDEKGVCRRRQRRHA